VAELTAAAKESGACFLLAAPWNHLDAAQKAADRMDGTLLILPPAVGATEGADSYPALFETIIRAMTYDREPGNG